MAKIDGGLRQIFRKHLRDVHWCTIESPLTEGGIPDTNFCADGVEGWIECKKTEGWAVTLRPLQVGWLLRRSRAGGRALVAVRRRCPAGPRSPAADELWLLAGAAARELKAHGLPRTDGVRWRSPPWPPATHLGRWAGGPRGWDWPAVRRVLTR